ncbi:hypothetical protein [Kutzneria sp. CA-103260]|uniref:hypothetical protein n=1 Tax=Kutzneria sp. CA-103260 TaxID=2802641 RepID=UPI001BA8010B|nr:hypothetical protein [Kutzneria sp. CA-103260]QUQ63890.1 hypothetical protein JJ691_16070 [Kutzneria sp. CA-103260]
MTTCDDTAAPCQSCSESDLPVNPFSALRVAFGMLLGEDDFRTMMGNPRGKQMLHAAWLHGSGVAWGYQVALGGEYGLSVSPGLAVDGHGRELFAETSLCLNLMDWVTAQKPTSDTITATLVADFACVPTSLVPTLADPCDVTRKHDDYSRVLETVRLSLRPDDGTSPPPTYRRLRVLFGLLAPGTDQASLDALAAIEAVMSAPEGNRAQVLLAQFRQLAAADAAELKPAAEAGVEGLSLFPATDEKSGVVLARLVIKQHEVSGAIQIDDVAIDSSARTTLLPTSVIQELAAGTAPSLFGTEGTPDYGGPRVLPDSLNWTDDRTLEFRVTAPVNARSLRRAVRITSLSPDRGWADDDVDTIEVRDGGTTVVVRLADQLANDTGRLIVRGTGPEPAFGVAPAVPLAGVAGGPPAGKDDGRDAVIMFPRRPRP